jgi:hypothetical protein
MAGIFSRVVRTTGGVSTVVIPEQGNEVISLTDMVVEQPGVGTHSYAVQCKLGDVTDSPLPRSRRRVLVVIRYRK